MVNCMKKVFVEPEMKKIELNLNENIATSISNIEFGFVFWYEWNTCVVHDTGVFIFGSVISEEALRRCRAEEMDKPVSQDANIVPEAIVRAYVRK